MEVSGRAQIKLSGARSAFLFSLCTFFKHAPTLMLAPDSTHRPAFAKLLSLASMRAAYTS